MRQMSRWFEPFHSISTHISHTQTAVSVQRQRDSQSGMADRECTSLLKQGLPNDAGPLEPLSLIMLPHHLVPPSAQHPAQTHRQSCLILRLSCGRRGFCTLFQASTLCNMTRCPCCKRFRCSAPLCRHAQPPPQPEVAQPQRPHVHGCKQRDERPPQQVALIHPQPAAQRRLERLPRRASGASARRTDASDVNALQPAQRNDVCVAVV